MSQSESELDPMWNAIDRAVDTSESRIKARLDGMEKAVEVFHADLTRVPTQVDRSILALRELVETRLTGIESDVEGIHANIDKRGADIKDQITHFHSLIMSEIKQVDVRIDMINSVSVERFIGIDKQFIARDTSAKQLSDAASTAIAAALQAAKEAVDAQNKANTTAMDKSTSATSKSLDQLQDLFNTAIKAMDDKIMDVKSRVDRGEGKSGGSSEFRKDNRDNMALVVSVFAVVAAMGSFLIGYTHH